MPVSDPTGTTVVELSRAEQWVVHHVLLESLGLADGERCRQGDAEEEPAEPSLGILQKLEEGTFAFTGEELSFLRRACSDHARTTRATADRNLASSVADRIDSAIQGAAARS